MTDRQKAEYAILHGSILESDEFYIDDNGTLTHFVELKVLYKKHIIYIAYADGKLIKFRIK